jgi:undecaprenyl-diphosphatase
MRYITHLGGARFTLGVSLALIAVGGPERSLGLAALVANVSSHLAVQILKLIVARPRPCDTCGVPLALIALPDANSFPSGHAAASMAVSVTLTLAHPYLGPAILPLAVLVAISRVKLRVHYTGDVIAGAFLGLCGGAASTILLP